MVPMPLDIIQEDFCSEISIKKATSNFEINSEENIAISNVIRRTMATTSSTINWRRRRVCRYIRKIKYLMNSASNLANDSTTSIKLNTVNALEKAIELIRYAIDYKLVPTSSSKPSIENTQRQFDLMESKNALKRFRETSIESSTINNGGNNKPASPADSSTWSSPSVAEETSTRPNEDENIENRRHRRASDDNVSAMDLYSTARFSPNTILATSTSPSLPIYSAPSKCEEKSSLNSFPIGSFPFDQTMRGRRYFGSLVVSLPDGIVLECYPSSSLTTSENNEILTTNVDNNKECLTKILKPGDSFLNILHGKSAQTMHLNSFSNTPQRRMYARLKWADELRACEFLCEFCVDPNHAGRRIVTIHVLCVNETALQKQQKLAQAFFITRHNASGAIVFIDVACFPIIGHFPSELFGKSLFKLLHSEDVNTVKKVHEKLQNSVSGEIVATNGLRLINFNNEVVYVDSEWTAFVNPWTRQVEMVVGRHKRAILNNERELFDENIVAQTNFNNNNNKTQSISKEFSKPLQQTINKSVASTAIYPEKSPIIENNLGAYMERIVESLVMNSGGSVVQQNSSTKSQQKLVGELASKEATLSYNQIKCLENVNRLIKSIPLSVGDEERDITSQQQSKINYYSILANNNNNDIKSQSGSTTSQLTQEMLQKHDLRCELESKDNWKRRLIRDLSLKRIAQTPVSELQQQSNAKIMRFNENNNNQNIISATNNNNESQEQQFLQASKLIPHQQHQNKHYYKASPPSSKLNSVINNNNNNNFENQQNYNNTINIGNEQTQFLNNISIQSKQLPANFSVEALYRLIQLTQQQQQHLQFAQQQQQF